MVWEIEIEKLSFHTLKVPYGKRFNIIFSDLTTFWPESAIHFFGLKPIFSPKNTNFWNEILKLESVAQESFTYANSMPGKLASCLMQIKTMDPVIFMDELDKISDLGMNEIIGILVHLIDYKFRRCSNIYICNILIFEYVNFMVYYDKLIKELFSKIKQY